MGIIAGLLGLPDGDRKFGQTVGQRVVFEAAQEYVRAIEEEAAQFRSFFVQERTSEFKRRYKLPGGGFLQERSQQTEAAAVKPYGEWDVAFPLWDRGSQLAWTDIEFAYMTPNSLDNYLETIRVQYMNTLRRDILSAMFDSTARTFLDKQHGSLSIQPLANGDSVVYPPVLGSSAEATESHYIETNYATASMSDTNNPYKTAREELEEHFGMPTGFGNIVALINNAELPKSQALTDWFDVEDMGVRYGNDSDLALLGPMSPGRRVGRVSGVWASVYPWIPATYMVFVDADQPKPLIERVDPADTGITPGLDLVSESDRYPMQMSHYRARYGFGAGNRLNGVVLELNTGGSYTVPAAYDL